MLGGTGIHQPVFTRRQIAEKFVVLGGIGLCLYYIEGTTSSWLIRLLLLGFPLLPTILVPVTGLPAVEAGTGWRSFLLLLVVTLLLAGRFGWSGDGVYRDDLVRVARTLVFVNDAGGDLVKPESARVFEAIEEVSLERLEGRG
jgi:hypothetical protein